MDDRVQSIPVEKHSIPYFEFSITLERDLTVGNYTGAVATHSNAPSKYYAGFLERISETIREEILLSTEASANYLSLDHAVRLFKCDSANHLRQFLESKRSQSLSRGVTWSIEGTNVLISRGVKKENQIDTDAVIKKLIEYSHEIETGI